MNLNSLIIKNRFYSLIALFLVALLLTVFTYRTRAQNQDGDVIRVCVRLVGPTSKIGLLVKADQCEPGWKELTWNVQGRQGEPGKDGVPGINGQPGKDGAPGLKGDPGDSFWSKNGSAIIYDGNVGIGNSNPRRKLEIGVDDNGGFGFDTSISPNSGYLRFGDNTGWKFNIARSREMSGGALNTGNTGVLMTIKDNGNVGIGITDPIATLHVNGDVITTGQFRTGKGIFEYGIDPPFVSFTSETHESIRQFARTAESFEMVMQFWNSEAHRMEVYVIAEDRFYTLTGDLIEEDSK